MTCPYLEYRDEGSGRTFDEARAYCTAADRFVQPMRADICNDRYNLDHVRHCEIYRAHAGGDDAVPAEAPSKSPETGSAEEGSE